MLAQGLSPVLSMSAYLMDRAAGRPSAAPASLGGNGPFRNERAVFLCLNPDCMSSGCFLLLLLDPRPSRSLSLSNTISGSNRQSAASPAGSDLIPTSVVPCHQAFQCTDSVI